MKAELQTKEQHLLLKYLLDIPPLEYLKECNTSDRKKHWEDCKNFYLCLRQFLKNHFSGLALPIEEIADSIHIEDAETILTFSTQQQKETFLRKVELEFNYYYDYYGVISRGWRYIKPFLEEREKKTDNQSFPKTPGEALIKIIEQNFHGYFLVLFPEYTSGNYYSEYSPQKLYKKQLEYKKLTRKNPKDLNSTEKQKIENFKRQKQKESKTMNCFTGLQNFLLEICLSNAKAKKDSVLKRRLTSLEAATAEIIAERKRNTSPRHAGKGWAVNHGVLLEGRKEGGVYSEPQM